MFPDIKVHSSTVVRTPFTYVAVLTTNWFVINDDVGEYTSEREMTHTGDTEACIHLHLVCTREEDNTVEPDKKDWEEPLLPQSSFPFVM